MKQLPGKDLVILGSGTLVSELTKLGLIDQYQLMVNPVVLGNGTPYSREWKIASIWNWMTADRSHPAMFCCAIRVIIPETGSKPGKQKSNLTTSNELGERIPIFPPALANQTPTSFAAGSTTDGNVANSESILSLYFW